MRGEADEESSRDRRRGLGTVWSFQRVPSKRRPTPTCSSMDLIPTAALAVRKPARHGSAGVQRSILVDDEPQLPTGAQYRECSL